MSSDSSPRSGAASRNVTPTGRLGFRGRQATPEERELILDEFFFEGDRRQPYLVQFFILMVLSAGIAGFGLANDSAAVVIGAMLVAPLMTPILATSAAIVQGWLERTATSLAIVVVGSLVAIGVGLIVAWLTARLSTGAPLPGELLARTSPNLGDLAIAVLAGVAGAFVSVRSEASSALPGVGIAVALVPPLATIGMTIGLGQIDLAIGATLLYLTNLVGIILAAIDRLHARRLRGIRRSDDVTRQAADDGRRTWRTRRGRSSPALAIATPLRGRPDPGHRHAHRR